MSLSLKTQKKIVEMCLPKWWYLKRKKSPEKDVLICEHFKIEVELR